MSKIMARLSLIQQDLEAAGESDRLALASNDIAKAFEDSQTAFEAFYQGQASKGAAGKKILEDFIAKLKEDQVALDNAINHYSSFAMTHGESAHHTEQQIHQAQEEYKAQDAEIVKAIEELRDYGIEAEQKLVTIKFLRDIITDELVSQGANSFVQLKEFKNKMKELKGMLEKSHDSKFAPLVTTLLTLAEQRGFSDSNLLTQVLNTLDKLSENIREFRHQQEDAGKKAIEDLKQLQRNKLAEIVTLQRNHDETISQLNNAQSLLKKLSGEKELLASEVHRKEGELGFWADLGAYQEGLHQRILADRERIAEALGELKHNALQ